MRKLYLILFIPLFINSCNSDEDPIPEIKIDASNVNFVIDYYEPFDNTIYPSLILGLREQAENLTFFTLFATNITDEDQTVMVQLNQNNLAEATSLTKTLDPGDNIIEFTINWDYESLKYLDQPGSSNFAYSLIIDGETISTVNKTISFRSVGECVYGYVDENNQIQDTKYMFAAYVNEDNPKIDEFLADSKSHGIITSYKGYQGTPAEVRSEVFSIWYHLQKNSTQYSNITSTSNSSVTVFSQNVRFFDQVLDNSSANCVDGSAFISSILLKLGIEPVIILIPGHMYMGYYAAPNKKEFTLLETTAIGNVNINQINSSPDLQPYADNGYFTDEQINYYNNSCNQGGCDIEYMRKVLSEINFNYALNVNIDSFNDNLTKFNDVNDPTYQVFDIKQLRQSVSPIGR